MNDRMRFSSGEQHQHDRAQQQQPGSGLEFASVEDMLRHDALHTPVPPAIGHRLRESLARTPPPARSWWRRLFGL